MGADRTLSKIWSVVWACVVLAGCGGGGGSSPAPNPAPPGSTPLPSASPAPSSSPASLKVDCTGANGACPTMTIAGEAPSGGGFHGYADPSMRHDPVTGVLELAYSWPRTLADGAHVVDLHLAHSTDGGASWTYDGTLWSSTSFANPGTGAYAATNDTSTETVNLLPVAGNGSTLWVQAHWSYLVAAGSTAIYGQTATTSYVSVSAVAVPAGAAPNTLLGLSTAPEARLGAAATDATLHPTVNLAALAPPYGSCNTFQQPAMAFTASILYLALQCSNGSAPGAFAVFSTIPNGADATKWTWVYAGQIATAAQAQALAKSEGLPYTFFTELDFATSKSGQLLAIVSGAEAVSGGVQPFEQFGCRAIPVTSLSPPGLQTNSAGVPAVVASVTASDLYAAPNEGPGACTYDAASSTGMVIVRKLEDDPSLGFFVSLQASHASP